MSAGRASALRMRVSSAFSAADEEFDELCFEFGIELDEVVSDD